MTSAGDSPAFIPGPLDELFPGLRRQGERLAALPVHPRVVRAEREDGSYSLVFVSFTTPANARAFHAALKPLVEAALLVELARPPSQLKEDTGRLTSLELFTYTEPSFALTPAMRPFGFERAPLDAPAAVKPLALVRREALLVDGVPGDEPLVRYSARVSYPSEVERIGLDAALKARVSDAVFGEAPGELARALAACAAERANLRVEPTRAGIEALEGLLVQKTPGVVRYMPPLAFQGLCDLIAVAAHTTWHMEVEWGVCEPDPDTGLAPPPLVRVTRAPDTWHVPLGEHVLRWCIMPLSPGEEVPTLGAWAEHEFA